MPTSSGEPDPSCKHVKLHNVSQTHVAIKGTLKYFGIEYNFPKEVELQCWIKNFDNADENNFFSLFFTSLQCHVFGRFLF